MRPIPVILVVTAALLGTGGCGSDQPPVCDSLDAVQTTMDHVRDANVSENGLTQLETGLQQLRTDLQQLAADAKAQFAPEIDMVKNAANQFRVSVDDARAAPDAKTLAAVQATRTTLRSSVQNLGDAMSGTC
ncbi:hypothetical protein AB0J80_29305 [Actinoplanes sp. NPDC049548]|uniref:hypothetical protein n=1 Tax=Actinoplanes sp. NPDC049548 TaxID=3155152 RepID=UPI00342763D9